MGDVAGVQQRLRGTPGFQFQLWADLQRDLGLGLPVCEKSLPLLTSTHHKGVLCRLVAEKMKT